MKKSILLFVVLIGLVYGCSKDDSDSEELEALYGTWQFEEGLWVVRADNGLPVMGANGQYIYESFDFPGGQYLHFLKNKEVQIDFKSNKTKYPFNLWTEMDSVFYPFKYSESSDSITINDYYYMKVQNVEDDLMDIYLTSKNYELSGHYTFKKLQ